MSNDVEDFISNLAAVNVRGTAQNLDSTSRLSTSSHGFQAQRVDFKKIVSK